MNNVSKRILAFALAVATVIAFTPAIAFTQSASAATRPGKVSWASESKTQTTITLNWKKASKASGYSVYQKKSGKYVKVKTTGSRTYTVKKLNASKTYKFYVKAYRTSHGKNIYGKRSPVKTVTTCNKSAAAQWNIGASASGKAFDGSNGSSSVTATLTTKGVIAMKGSGNTVVFSSKNRAPWTVGTYRTKVKSGTIGSNVKPTNMDYWYYKCSNMTSAPELPAAETTTKKAREVSGNATCVNSVVFTWAGTGIPVAPELRIGVVNASFAFSGCWLLETGSNIPGTVNNMNGTYENCSNLTGAIQVNCGNETSCKGFLTGAATAEACSLAITGTSGNSPLMETIKTDNSGNLNIKVIESPTPVAALSVKVSYILSDKIISAFSASAQGGTGSYHYQWYARSPVGGTFEKIDNATESTYKIPATGDFPSGAQCKCIVTDFANNTAEATGIYHNGAVVQSWNIGAASAGVNYTGSNGTDSVVATLFPDGGLDITGTGDTVVFDLALDNTMVPWTADKYKSQVKTSTIASGVTPTNMECWYRNCTALTTAPTIPSSVKNMGRTFYGCTSLTAAPAISSSVTNMNYTFEGCTALTTAPTIPGSVTDMNYTFEGCTALTTAPTIPGSVTDMYGTFAGCSALTTAPTIPGSVEKMVFTFNNCTALTTAPTIPGSVTDMYGTFAGCSALTTAPTIPGSVENMRSTFFGCAALTGTMLIKANISDSDLYMNCFNGASTNTNASLKVNYLSSNQTVVTGIYETRTKGQITGNSNITLGSAAIDAWNIGASKSDVNYNGSNGTSSVVATLYSDGELAVTGSGNTVVFGDATSGTGAYKTPWNLDGKTKDVKSATIASGVTPTNMGHWYEDCAITAAPAIPSSVTEMDSTFQGCDSLTAAPDLSECTQLTNMKETFQGCTALKAAPTIPSSVTNMASTFAGCTALTTAPTIPSSVLYMGYTFFGCTVLTTAPTIPSSVIGMNGTFYGCAALTGTMQINANPDDYDYCFTGAATNSGTNLEVYGSTSAGNGIKVNDMVNTKSNNSNITYGGQNNS